MRQGRNYGIVKADPVAIAGLYAWMNGLSRMNNADEDEALDQIEQPDSLSDADAVVADPASCLEYDCTSNPHVTCANCRFAPNAH